MATFDTSGLKSSIRSDDLVDHQEQNKRLSDHLRATWKDKKIHLIERVERVDPASTRSGWRIWYED